MTISMIIFVVLGVIVLIIGLIIWIANDPRKNK